MKLLIPVKENKGLDSEIDAHFGHAQLFALLDSEAEKLEFIENKIEHSDPFLTPVDQIMVHKPDMVYSLEMGLRAIRLFKEKNVKLKTGNFTKIKDVIENIGKLEDLEVSCGH